MPKRIELNTKLFGSFSNNPGNKGSRFFNRRFNEDNYNAIYKPFYADNIVDVISATRILKFSGFALSSPFKKQVIPFLTHQSPEARMCMACNTVVVKGNELHGHNTDYLAIDDYIRRVKPRIQRAGITSNYAWVLGNGGYSASAVRAFHTHGFGVFIIDRAIWGDIKNIRNAVVFNATPVKGLGDILDSSNFFIDCDVQSWSGKTLAGMQARKQYEIYKEVLS